MMAVVLDGGLGGGASSAINPSTADTATTKTRKQRNKSALFTFGSISHRRPGNEWITGNSMNKGIGEDRQTDR